MIDDELEAFDTMSDGMEKRLSFPEFVGEHKLLTILDGGVSFIELLKVTIDSSYSILKTPITYMTLTILGMNLISILDRKSPFYKVKRKREINNFII